MVLEDQTLGIAFVDEVGEATFTHKIDLANDDELKKFVGDELLSNYIK